MFLATAAPAQPPAERAPDVADIAMARIDDLGTPMDLKAHLYRPAGAGDVPLVLYIHGKGGSYNDPRDQVFSRVLAGMLSRGIAVARIDYRKSGRMPQMLMDTKAYIRFFRAHAREYHLDPHRFGIWGVSRGGNLAAMLAVTGDVKALEGDVGGNSAQSSLLQASVVESPLTDMFLSTDEKAASMFGDYLGTNDADSRAIVAAYRKPRHRQPILEGRGAHRTGQSAELCAQGLAPCPDCLRRAGSVQCGAELHRLLRQIYPGRRAGLLLCPFHRHPCAGGHGYRAGLRHLAGGAAVAQSAAHLPGCAAAAGRPLKLF